MLHQIKKGICMNALDELDRLFLKLKRADYDDVVLTTIKGTTQEDILAQLLKQGYKSYEEFLEEQSKHFAKIKGQVGGRTPQQILSMLRLRNIMKGE